MDRRKEKLLNYLSGAGIVVGLFAGVLLPQTSGRIAFLPSTSTAVSPEALTLLETTSLVWGLLLLAMFALIVVGIVRIARIPSSA